MNMPMLRPLHSTGPSVWPKPVRLLIVAPTVVLALQATVPGRIELSILTLRWFPIRSADAVGRVTKLDARVSGGVNRCRSVHCADAWI